MDRAAQSRAGGGGREGRKPPRSALKRAGQSSRSMPSKQESTAVSNLSFVMSLVCPYLMAKDLLALSLTSSAVRFRLRNGAARTLKLDLKDSTPDLAQHKMKLLSGAFPFAKEVIITGTREQCLNGLRVCSPHLPLARLAITFSDVEDASMEDHLNTTELARVVSSFPMLERLEVRHLGPMAPSAIKIMCSGKSLQMVRFTRCPMLTDSCLAQIIRNGQSLQEISVEGCPSLHKPIISSGTLVRLKLSQCIGLWDVIIDSCPALIILDVAYTSILTAMPSLSMAPNLKFISLIGAAGLESLETTCLPEGLLSLDLTACANLKTLTLGPCNYLVDVTLSYCIALESIVLHQARRLQSLNLTLLRKLKLVKIEDCLSMRSIALYGCDSLKPENVYVSGWCKRYA